jgi:hypothetical protein
LNLLDIRVQIHLSEPTDEQIKDMKKFCDGHKISHSENTVKLRKHFSDFLDEVKHEIRRALTYTKQEWQSCEGWFQQVANTA